jgi:peptidoglycan/LPS O-acetylase OafA/YrhL
MAAIESRQNAIGFIRVVLASLVIYYHCFPLSGLADPGHSLLYEISRLAVPGFFFLSGMLITRSYLGKPNWKHFLWNRILRIFPGYWACLLVCAFGFALLACQLEYGSVSAAFIGSGPIQYLTHDCLLVQKQPSIGQAFAHNPYPSSINGSLWTLINEFGCYIAVCLLGVAGLLSKRREIVLGLAAVLYVVYLLPAPFLQPHIPHKFGEYLYKYQLLHQGLYFALGSVVWLYREKIPLKKGLAVASVLMWIFVFATGGLAGRLLVPIGFSYLILWLAFRAYPVYNFDKKQDLSYGIYIYAFPVQQTLCLLGVYRFGVWPLFWITLIGTLPFAWLSWSLVEKRAMDLKRVRWKFLEPAAKVGSAAKAA